MHYISDKWQDVLAFNNLDSHEKIWALQAEWFEEPNYCRGGWSGVSRIELKRPEGVTVGVFLKRQENHMARTLRHPIKGTPTFSREFETIRAFQKAGIPSLNAVFFDQWESAGSKRACLMTEELAGYIPLSSEEYQVGGELLSNKEDLTLLFNKVAALMHVIHKHGFQHGCFYPKHIFVNRSPKGDFELRVIDLEKVKKPFCNRKAIFRDLDTLLRRSSNWSVEDKLEFFKIHQGEENLSARSKRLWKKLNVRKK